MGTDTVQHLRRVIEKHQFTIDDLGNKVKIAPTFEVSEDLLRQKREAEFDLAQLQKELAQEEQAATEAAYNKASNAYQAKLDQYNAGMGSYGDLGEKLRSSLWQMDKDLEVFYALAKDLNDQRSDLVKQAAELGKDEPDKAPYICGDPGPGYHLEHFISEDKNLWQKCFPARLLRHALNDYILLSDDKGYWIGHGLKK